MKLRTVIYSLLLATLLVGCGNRLSMRQLEQLEACVNDAPDSVLAVLTAADAPRWGERRALHALLTVQAQDKSYIDVVDDSFISVATHYYATSHDVRHRMLAYYYRARVQYNMGAYAQSIVSASRAEEAAITIGDDYYLGLIYRCISDCYNMTYNAAEELRYIRMAHECFDRVESAAHEQYARLRIGRACLSNGKLDEAIQICEVLLTDSAAIQDSILLSNVLSLYGKAATLSCDFPAAKEALLRLCEIPQYKWKVSDYCYLARIYNNEQLADSALFCLDKAKCLVRKDADSVYIYRALYEMALANEDAETALDNYRKIIALNDSVTKATLHQSVAIAHRDHYRNEALLTSERAMRDKRFFLVCLISILSVSAFGVLYYREGKKRKEVELARTLETAYEVTLTVKRQRDDLTAMQQRIDRLFGEQFTTLEILINTYLDHEGTDKNSILILHKVEALIEELRNPKKLRHLENIINESRHNIVARLREQIPSIKETDVQLFIYLCAGFSLRAIKLFMKEKLENIYNKKSRLKSKIQRSNAANADDFLEYLS